MFDEKTGIITLPDKRFIFLSCLEFINHFWIVNFYDREEDLRVVCDKLNEKTYKITARWHYNVPNIYKKNKTYNIANHTTELEYNDYQIFNYKLKTLDISYTIEVKNDIRYITIPNDIHQAMFEFYFGQSIKTDFGDNNDINI